MLRTIKNKYKNFKNYIKKLAQYDKPLCRLEEIDIIKRRVIIHCRGSSSVIKINLEEMIYDEILISNLPSVQAAWIGYYYGMYYNDFKSFQTEKICMYESFSDANCECSIIMLDRKGNIIYFDKTQNINYVSTPLMILKSRDLINKFKPMQAFYIGILSGVSINKNKAQSYADKPKLRVV